MTLHLHQEVALAATLRARDGLVRAARAVPQDRRRWQLGGVAKDVVAILAHCATTNLFFVSSLSGTPLPYRTQQERDEAISACDTLKKAEILLNRSVAAVCDAIVALPAPRLTEQMVTPEGERLLIALGLLEPSVHMHFHEGQINYVQTLLGDADYH